MVRMSLWLVVGGKTGARGRAVGAGSKYKRLYTDERRRGRVEGRKRVRRGEEKRRYSIRKSGRRVVRRRGREKKRPGCIGVPQQSPVNLLLLSVFSFLFYRAEAITGESAASIGRCSCFHPLSLNVLLSAPFLSPPLPYPDAPSLHRTPFCLPACKHMLSHPLARTHTQTHTH
jgi:hypothetical protein